MKSCPKIKILAVFGILRVNILYNPFKGFLDTLLWGWIRECQNSVFWTLEGYSRRHKKTWMKNIMLSWRKVTWNFWRFIKISDFTKDFLI